MAGKRSEAEERPGYILYSRSDFEATEKACAEIGFYSMLKYFSVDADTYVMKSAEMTGVHFSQLN